jgi:hypothetical protein
MAAVTPTTVMKHNHYADNMSGTVPRKLVKVYIECSPAGSETLNVATYVPGLTAVMAIEGSSRSFVSAPTFSGTTLTFPASYTAGPVALRVLGYY